MGVGCGAVVGGGLGGGDVAGQGGAVGGADRVVEVVEGGWIRLLVGCAISKIIDGSVPSSGSIRSSSRPGSS